MTGKIKVHIDPKGYDEKPSGKEIGGIKSRLQKGTRPSLVTLEELVQKIRTGHSISPGIMEGMSAKNWKEQQLFMVDIDNEEDGPILRIKDARAICRDNGLPLAFCYQTFSYTKEHPKFRLGFVMDKPITDADMRKHIMETLVNLFPQSDKSCVNADRIFHGTNKSAKLLNENGRISWEDIEAVSFPTRPEEHRSGHSSHIEMRSDSELEELVRNFDLFGYLKERNGGFRRTSKGVVFHNCEICKHHDNLMYVEETNTFCCRSEDKGGSIIDYLKYTEGLTTAQAIDKLKNELCEPVWKAPIPFEEVKLPSFPVDALPAPLCDWVKTVAENTETPVDMAAVSTLAALSCAVQGKFKIAPKRSYSEPLNLYILIIAKSGERKSAIVHKMADPIYQYEKSENRRRKEQAEIDLANLSSWKKQIDALERDGKIEEATKLRTKYRNLEDKRVKPLRLIADDVTPEALTSLLSENKGILTIISTEGGLFDTLAGRYSNVVSIDTMLKAYSGDRIRVDRKGRESEIVNDPALTMLLSAQDNVLEGLMRNDVFKSRGLNARILYCRPKSKVGTRHFDTPELSEELEKEYHELMLHMLPLWLSSAILLGGFIFFLYRKDPHERISLLGSSGEAWKLERKKHRIIYVGLFALTVATVVSRTPYWLAAAGIVLAVILLFDRAVLRKTDYVLLVTFFCFFVFSSQITANKTISHFLTNAVASHEYFWGIGLSQIISNVPASIVLYPFTDNLAALLYGVDTAGLCSVIGSLASVINYRLYVRSYPGQGGRFMKVFTLISWAFFLIVVIPGYFLSKYWLI